MRFDQEPDDPHWECGLQIYCLEQEVAALKAALAAKDAEIERLKAVIKDREIRLQEAGKEHWVTFRKTSAGGWTKL